MQRELGKDIPQGKQRIQFLSDNCDKIEEKGYMKRFDQDQLSEMKEQLSETAIKIDDIEVEKKAVMADFKFRLDPLNEKKKEILEGLREKAEFVRENCYKIIDQETREVGYYNQDGDLIESRPAYADELQGTIFQVKRTGTHD